MHLCLGEHAVVWTAAVSTDEDFAIEGLHIHSSSDFLRGGVLPAMMMSLAFPERSVFSVDL